MTAVLLSVVALLSTLAGGWFALKFRNRLPFILAFTAGVLLGVVAFDILPEIVRASRELRNNAEQGMIALVIGFLVFHALEKFVLIHHTHEHEYVAHGHPDVGMLSALALAGHSFLDGVGIGLGFQISSAVGITVAFAVITHDFCDGLNTVSLMLANRNTDLRSKAMLVIDALAPVAGAASTLLFQAPPAVLVVYLGFFAGFLLYIGAADILPQAHSRATPGTAVALIALTCLGALAVFVAGQLAG